MKHTGSLFYKAAVLKSNNGYLPMPSVTLKQHL